MGRVVLDASALIGFFGGQPSASEVAMILRRRPPASISASNLSEVVDGLMRVVRLGAEETRELINLLIAGGLEVEPAWIYEARSAGALRASHYDRQSNPISLADCFCLATALKLGAALATSDVALAATARKIGVEVIPLPNSNGARPAEA